MQTGNTQGSSAQLDNFEPGSDNSVTPQTLLQQEPNVPGKNSGQQARQRRTRKPPVCRYFATKKGCRAGEACPFLHEIPDIAAPEAQENAFTGTAVKDHALSAPAAVGPAASSASATKPRSSAVAPTPRQQHEVPVAAARVVARPVSTAEVQDPRAFQIKQIKTRFSAIEATGTDGGTELKFKMVPSDPDFPFEIEALECSIRVPLGFPQENAPTMRIVNREMERGYQINVERGFDVIWAQSKNSTLLGAMKILDKQLETLLTAQKADTIKLVMNTRTAPIKQEIPAIEQAISKSQTVQPDLGTPLPTRIPEPIISAQLREQAKKKRKRETEMLEHRLNRQTQFTREADGTIYTVPMDPRKRNALPVSLQAVKAVRLFVPESYDIDPCAIELLGVTGNAATNVERAFSKRVAETPEATLLTHINYLAQNMHSMTADIAPIPLQPKPVEPPKMVTFEAPKVQHEPRTSESFSDKQSHIQFIPRPPEWSSNPTNEQEQNSASDSEYTTSETGGDEDEDEDEEDESSKVDMNTPETSSAVREKGILISFPHMELYSIELLELTSPNITVKCERCKDTMDITRIKNNDKGDYTGIRSESCKKCAFSFGIGYRKDLMHINSIRAGYLDLDGCTVVDLLPSNFTPTCSECSTPFPAPGVVAVRGDSAMAMCRECHHKMSFRIPEVKFLNVGATAVHANRGLPRKKPKENLGIVAGQELPRRGRCSHYSKSYRWFRYFAPVRTYLPQMTLIENDHNRFSCCSKVFPCDRCHDEASDHPNEFANRMLCGFCSREQNYRPEDCGICHSPLTGKTGSGFWEGGKGTRDPRRMSRKDPRKYKRRGATAPRSTPKS